MVDPYDRKQRLRRTMGYLVRNQFIRSFGVDRLLTQDEIDANHFHFTRLTQASLIAQGSAASASENQE
jgi:hypothetical protein